MEELGLKDESQPRPSRMPQLGRLAEREGPLIFENVTVRQALNAIVEQVGTGVWLYSEWGIGAGRRALKIEITIIPLQK
jgi:hypothetical protein